MLRKKEELQTVNEDFVHKIVICMEKEEISLKSPQKSAIFCLKM